MKTWEKQVVAGEYDLIINRKDETFLNLTLSHEEFQECDI